MLLDTHVFIWWSSASRRLSKRSLAVCEDPENELIVSVASRWEMQIKLQYGKLTLQRSLAEIVEHQRDVNGVRLLPVRFKDVMALQGLPPHHKDPFDRLLMAQATVEQMPIVTADPVFKDYPVSVID